MALKRKWPIVVVMLAIILMIALRWTILRSKHTYLQDEGASLILITGHLADYDRVMYDSHYPAQTWAPAAEWKKFISLDRPVSFQKIAADAAVSDFHPPLFYWLLYQWYRVSGVDPWTGAGFCVLIAVLTALALFGFAAEVLKDRLEAAVVVFTWAVSPAVIVISEQARQYDLLAWWTVLLVWRVTRSSDPARPAPKLDLIGLFLFSLAGMLTHYHFALVISACLVYSFFKLVRVDPKRMAEQFAAMILGGLGLAVFHPGFYHSFQRGLNKERGFEIMEKGLDKAAGFQVWEGITRSIYMVKSLAGFFLDPVAFKNLFPGGALIWIGTWMVLLILLIFGIIWSRLHPTPAREKKEGREDRGGKIIAFFLLWIGGWTAVLYVSCISPSQAMGTRYLSAVWPFFAFLPVYYFRRWPARRKLITAMFCFFMFGAGILTAAWKYEQGAAVPDQSVSQYDQLLLDTLSRTQLPGSIYLAPDNVQVFAAYQDFLFAHPEAWTNGLSGKVVYVSRFGFGGNTPDKTKQVLDLIQQRRRLKSISSFGPGGFVMEVEKN